MEDWATLTRHSYPSLRYGSHIVPIVEDPALVSVMVEKHSHGGFLPFAWHVGDGEYGKASSWGARSPALKDLADAQFRIERDWLVRVHGGDFHNLDRRVLILEADSSVGEEALALGPGSANDLSVQVRKE